MAIDAKMDFLRRAESALADSVTVSDMVNIMNVLSDVLQGFDMRSIAMFNGGDDDLLKCFLDAKTVENKSEKTINRYRYEIKRLMSFVNVPVRNVTVYHLRAYLQHLKTRGLMDSSIEGIRQVYSSYFNWLQREALISVNPVANLGTVKTPKKQKQIYSDVDIEKLVRECKQVRDQAIVHFLASTGCRISEMTSLNRDQVDVEKLECIVHGKGNKERVVYMSPVAGMLISEYLETRKNDANPALFVGRKHERLLPNGVRVMLKVLQKKTGVTHVHPHKFRRTLATDLARRGMPIQEIANILGHEKIDTTMKYVMADNETIKGSYRRFA